MRTLTAKLPYGSKIWELNTSNHEGLALEPPHSVCVQLHCSHYKGGRKKPGTYPKALAPPPSPRGDNFYISLESVLRLGVTKQKNGFNKNGFSGHVEYFYILSFLVGGGRPRWGTCPQKVDFFTPSLQSVVIKTSRIYALQKP